MNLSKGMYIGVDGKARKVKKAYIGVDSVARKVKKAYIGVNGVARLFYQAGTPTTSTVLFNLNSFTDGDAEIIGQATSALQDGDTPTMTISTSSANGFVLSNRATAGETSIYAIVNGIVETTLAQINDMMIRTSASRSYGVRFRNSSSSYNSVKTYIFDFKKPRTLTLNYYWSHGLANSTYSKFYGSNDGATWVVINEELEGSETYAITVTTAYQYYKIETQSYDNHEQNLMYFTNVSDTIYE